MVPAQELAALSGFHEAAPGVIAALAADQVHRIERVLARDPWRDVALLRLDGRALQPLELAEAPPRTDDALYSVNHGMGVPAKLVDGAQAFSVGDDSFLTDLDAFGGASGAPVFDVNGLVVGMLTSGARDWSESESGCWTTRYESPGGVSANELVEHARSLVDDLCAAQFVPESCPPDASVAQACALVRGALGTGQPNGWLTPLTFAFGTALLARRRALSHRSLPTARPLKGGFSSRGVPSRDV